MIKQGRYFGSLILTLLTISACAREQVEEIVGSSETLIQSSETVVASSEKEVVEEVSTIYPRNKIINLYLNKYNELNSDDIISSEMFYIYHHHGRDHDDQIKFDDKDGFEVLISERIGKIHIYIQGYHNKKSNDEFLVQVKKFLIPLLSNQDDNIDDYWQEVLRNQANFTTFSEFEIYIISKNISSGEIEALEIISK